MPRCKCCDFDTVLLGAVDFNKSCADRGNGRVFPASGNMVPYYRCGRCGFIFTDYCDGWSADDFAAKIYNDDYLRASGTRGVTGKKLASMLEGGENRLRLLDFGAGGNPGAAGRDLIESGFEVTSYEPYFAGSPKPLEGQFDFIYAIEVIEHCRDLADTARFFAAHLAEHGMCYFSTLLHPFPSDDDVLNSWYIAPRNGHISIFTLPAMTFLFRRVGINMVQSAFGIIGFKKFPDFPNKFFI